MCCLTNLIHGMTAVSVAQTCASTGNSCQLVSEKQPSLLTYSMTNHKSKAQTNATLITAERPKTSLFQITSAKARTKSRARGASRVY